MGKCPTETSYKLPGISWWNLMGIHFIFPAIMYENTCEVLQTREAHKALVFQVFIGVRSGGM